MKGRHAHIDSAVLACLVVGTVGLIDLVIDVADGHPFKPIIYLVFYFLVYLLVRLFHHKVW